MKWISVKRKKPKCIYGMFQTFNQNHDQEWQDIVHYMDGVFYSCSVGTKTRIESMEPCEMVTMLSSKSKTRIRTGQGFLQKVNLKEQQKR